MDINNLNTTNNDNTNNYSITSSLTNVFNRGVAIVSSIFSYLPFFSSETDNNILPEDNIGIEDKKPLDLQYISWLSEQHKIYIESFPSEPTTRKITQERDLSRFKRIEQNLAKTIKEQELIEERK